MSLRRGCGLVTAGGAVAVTYKACRFFSSLEQLLHTKDQSNLCIYLQQQREQRKQWEHGVSDRGESTCAFVALLAKRTPIFTNSRPAWTLARTIIRLWFLFAVVECSDTHERDCLLFLYLNFELVTCFAIRIFSRALLVYHLCNIQAFSRKTLTSSLFFWSSEFHDLDLGNSSPPRYCDVVDVYSLGSLLSVYGYFHFYRSGA